MKDEVLRLESKFVDLSKSINSYINENFKKFSIRLAEDEIRLQYEQCLTEQHSFPVVTLGSFDKKRGEIKFSEANDVFAKLAENFSFERKVIAVNGSPIGNIKTEHVIFEHEKNPFNLSLNVMEESVDIVLQYNTMIYNAVFPKTKLVQESVELDAYLEEQNILMEGLFGKNKYQKQFEQYETMMKLNNITVLDINKWFHSSYVQRFEQRFHIANNSMKDGYVFYKNPYEHDMIVRWFIKLINALYTEKTLPKDVAYAMTFMMINGQPYPMLFAFNAKAKKLVGLYFFSIHPVPKKDGAFHIYITEVFRTFYEETNDDVIALRKYLNCAYFD
jgi:hypothetical protein